MALRGVRLGRLAGRYASPRDLAFDYVVDPTPFYASARLLDALAGALAAGLLAYGVARRFDALSGALAGLLMGLSPQLTGKLHAAIDEPMLVLACTAVLLALDRALDRRSPRWLALAALLAGVAAGTKYNGAATGLPWLFAAVALWRSGVAPRRIAPALLLVPLGFFVTTPRALLDWTSFTSQVAYNRGQLGHDGPFFANLAAYLYGYADGFLVQFAVIPAALGWLIRGRPADRRARVLLATALTLAFALALYLARGTLCTPRYAFPAQPWLAAATGLGLAAFLRRAWSGAVAVRVPAAALVCVLFGAACVSAIRQGLDVAARVARFEMTARVRKLCAPGDRIVTDWYGPLLPLTDHVERFPARLARAEPPVVHVRAQPLYDYVARGLNELAEGGSPLDFTRLRELGYRLIVMNDTTWKRAEQPDAHPDLRRFLDELGQLPPPEIVRDDSGTWGYRIYRLD